MDIGLLDVVEFEFMYFKGIYGLIYFSVICLGIHTPPIFRGSIKMINQQPRPKGAGYDSDLNLLARRNSR